jgi:hypothetical protein
MIRKQTWWHKTKKRILIHLKTLKARISSLLFTVFAGLIIQFFWNKTMDFFSIKGYDIHLFEAAILWMICL